MAQIIASSSGKPFATTLSVRSLQWTSDEPPEAGGTDAGPTPYELFLGSIAACSAITVRMYAARKGWNLAGVRIEIDHRKLDPKDLPEERRGAGPITEISMEISFEGDLSDEQRQRLLDIAGRCPVKRAVEGEVVFKSGLRPPGS